MFLAAALFPIPLLPQVGLAAHALFVSRSCLPSWLPACLLAHLLSLHPVDCFNSSAHNNLTTSARLLVLLSSPLVAGAAVISLPLQRCRSTASTCQRAMLRHGDWQRRISFPHRAMDWVRIGSVPGQTGAWQHPTMREATQEVAHCSSLVTETPPLHLCRWC